MSKQQFVVRALSPERFCRECVHLMDGAYTLNQELPEGVDLPTPYVDEIPGNEALLSAAPELLTALKRVLSSIPITVDSVALTYDIADAARVIAKAEGRTDAFSRALLTTGSKP